MATVSTQAVVIGASAAGLAVSACLKDHRVPFEMLEAQLQVGKAWRGHYDRLHLHTTRQASGLPMLPMPRSYPRYPTRDQVVTYLETYRHHFDLQPRFGQHVRLARPTPGGGWRVETGDHVYLCEHVVVATGHTRRPVVPTFPGQEGYGGDVLHSSDYRNGAPWRGRRVLVVGFGNSGCEIAIDLYEHGARPLMSVRSAVHIVPRDLFGVSAATLGGWLRHLPAFLTDAVARPVLRVLVGDLRKHGLRRAARGPMGQVKREGRVPALDIGTLALIRAGIVHVHPGIERFTPSGVVFTNGVRVDADAVVLATGYEPAVHAFVDAPADAVDSAGVPRASGTEVAPGLWFCGFDVSPAGMLREIAREAPRIARGIAGRARPGRILLEDPLDDPVEAVPV